MFGLTPRRSRSQGDLASQRGEWGRFPSALEDLFERFMGQWPVPPGTDPNFMRFWDFHVTEGDNEVVVRAEMPGFEVKDVDVQLADNVLTIKAEARQEGKEGQSLNTFYRAVTLPSGVDTDKADASYRNGVLELHIPRSPQAQGKRIPVRQAQGETQETDQGQSATEGATGQGRAG